MELMEEMNECICNTVECESRPSGLVRLATIKLGLNSKEKKKSKHKTDSHSHLLTVF